MVTHLRAHFALVLPASAIGGHPRRCSRTLGSGANGLWHHQHRSAGAGGGYGRASTASAVGPIPVATVQVVHLRGVNTSTNSTFLQAAGRAYTKVNNTMRNQKRKKNSNSEKQSPYLMVLFKIQVECPLVKFSTFSSYLILIRKCL